MWLRSTPARVFLILIALGLGFGAVAARADEPRGGQASSADWLVSPDGVAAVRKALGLREVSVQRIVPEVAGEQAIVSVDLGGGTGARTLALDPYSLRAEGFVVLIDDGSGAPPRPLAGMGGEGELPITTYRGTIAEEPDTVVCASIFDGGVRAGVRLPDATVWRIQPLSDAIPGADPGLHAVYRESDVIADNTHRCGVEDRATDPGTGDASAISDRGPGVTCNRFAEVVFDTDWEYFSTFLSSPNPSAACVADIESIMNEIDLTLQRDITVSTIIRAIVLRTSAADPYTDTTDYNRLLDEMRVVWQGISQASQPRDYLHLMTGRDITGNVIGLAYVGVMCNSSLAIGFSQTNFTPTFSRRVLLTAHEMGHEWNAPHDNESGSPCSATPDGFIMNPIIASQALQYSSCSIGLMLTHRNGPASTCVLAPTSTPQARPDAAYVQISQSADLDPLRNDTSNCGALSSTLPSTTTPGGGTLSILAGAGPHGRNLVRYTPTPTFTGTDSFSYTATNGVGNTTGAASVTVAVPRAPDAVPRMGPGLTVRFYDLVPGLTTLPAFASLPAFLATSVSQINVASTTGAFAGSGRSNNVGAVYKGFVSVPTTGLYTFFTESDDGSRLYIGSQLVVDNDGVHGMQERSGAIGLQAGNHALRVEFFESTGSAGLIVRYQGPSITKQVLPAAALVRTEPCPGDVNIDEAVNADDIFFYLDAWFAQIGQAGSGLVADFNHDNLVNPDDLFAFLDAWFGPCA